MIQVFVFQVSCSPFQACEVPKQSRKQGICMQCTSLSNSKGWVGPRPRNLHRRWAIGWRSSRGHPWTRQASDTSGFSASICPARNPVSRILRRILGILYQRVSKGLESQRLFKLNKNLWTISVVVCHSRSIIFKRLGATYATAALWGPFASRTPRLPHPSKLHGYVPPGPGTYATALDVKDSSPSASFALPGAGNPAKYFLEADPGPGSYLGTDAVVPSGTLAVLLPVHHLSSSFLFLIPIHLLYYLFYIDFITCPWREKRKITTSCHNWKQSSQHDARPSWHGCPRAWAIWSRQELSPPDATDHRTM